MELAKDEKTRILGPNPTAKDLPTILRELSPDASEMVRIEKQGIDPRASYVFHDSKGGSIQLIYVTEGAYRVDTSASKELGTPILQTIYTWAYNNGKQIDEDYEMHEDGVYRRNAHMLSNALRFGTTRHMTVGRHSGIEDRWIRNDDSPEATTHNIGLLALNEAKIVKDRLKALPNVRYDLDTQSVYDGDYRIPDEEVETYLEGRIRGVDPKVSHRVGAATYRRALAVSGLAKGIEQGRSGLLVGDDAGAPRSLHEIFYSKDAGRDSGVSESGERTAGEESRGISGEAGRGGSGPEVNAARTAQVQAWVESTRKNWKSKLDVVVHDSAAAIPNATLRSQVLSEGGNVEAFFDPVSKTIHLLADRIGSKADTERLMRHEGIHWVVSGPMQKEFQAILAGVRKRISPEDWAALSKSYAEFPDHVRVEEYLAYLGQTNPQSTVWQSFVYEMKQMLRNFFGADFEVTDSDVLAFLNKANRKLETGKTGKGSGPRDKALRFAKGRISASDGGPDDLIAGNFGPLPQDEAIELIRSNPTHPTTQALRAWFGADHRKIQDGRAPEQEKALREFLDRLPVYQTAKPLYRAVPFWNEYLRNEYLKGFSGKFWSNPNPFMSASKKNDAAFGIGRNSLYPIFMIIHQNKTAKDVSSISELLAPDYSWQEELIFKHEANFKIMSTSQIDMGKRSIYSISLEEQE